MRRDRPGAAPEDLAHGCRRAGLGTPATFAALLGRPVGSLDPGERQRLETAMALVAGSPRQDRVLVTSGGGPSPSAG